MKYLLVLVLLVLTGCNYESAESLGIHIGQVVTIRKGFYKGCKGTITIYDDYDSIDDMIGLVNVSCGTNIQLTIIYTEAKNIKE